MKNKIIFPRAQTIGAGVSGALLGVITALVLASVPMTAHATTTCAQPGTWFDPGSREKRDTTRLMADLAGRGVVLLGETHDNPDHHLWQFQVISALHALNQNMVLTFESFPRSSQPALDKWVQGQIGEEEFLKQSRWFDVWRFDPDLYWPLFHFARQNRIPMLAMNVDRALISRIGREGFDAVPEADRLGIGRPTPPPQAYLRSLATVFGGHGASRADDQGGQKEDDTDAILKNPAFRNFADAQAAWDRAMAERIAEARTSGGAPLVVGIVGRGHLDYGHGIPHQLKALGIADAAVLTPWDADRPCADLTDESGTPVADAAFAMMPPAARAVPEKPRLGIMIRPLDDGAGIAIDDVVPGSIAAKTGLQAGDIITGAAGRPVTTSRDLITIIQAQPPGSWLPLVVRRKDATIEMIAKFPPPPPDTPATAP